VLRTDGVGVWFSLLVEVLEDGESVAGSALLDNTGEDAGEERVERDEVHGQELHLDS